MHRFGHSNPSNHRTGTRLFSNMDDELGVFMDGGVSRTFYRYARIAKIGVLIRETAGRTLTQHQIVAMD